MLQGLDLGYIRAKIGAWLKPNNDPIRYFEKYPSIVGSIMSSPCESVLSVFAKTRLSQQSLQPCGLSVVLSHSTWGFYCRALWFIPFLSPCSLSLLCDIPGVLSARSEAAPSFCSFEWTSPFLLQNVIWVGHRDASIHMDASGSIFFTHLRVKQRAEQSVKFLGSLTFNTVTDCCLGSWHCWYIYFTFSFLLNLVLFSYILFMEKHWLSTRPWQKQWARCSETWYPLVSEGISEESVTRQENIGRGGGRTKWVLLLKRQTKARNFYPSQVAFRWCHGYHVENRWKTRRSEVALVSCRVKSSPLIKQSCFPWISLSSLSSWLTIALVEPGDRYALSNLHAYLVVVVVASPVTTISDLPFDLCRLLSLVLPLAGLL